MSEKSTLSRAGRWLFETLPAFALALFLLPFLIPHGTLSPWHPSTTDLEIYRLAVIDMLHGKDFYATQSPGWLLYFIYPPIAAILMIPISWGPYSMWQVLWTFLLVWSQQAILRRCGVPRGWITALAGLVLVGLVEPIRTTLGYGQVNTALMACAVIALLPDTDDRGRRRPAAWGLLIGLAAAVKLTPAYLAVVAFFSRRAAVAWWAFAGFCALTLIGVIALPQESLRFWTNDIPARTSGPVYVGNQSLFGLAFRWFGQAGGPYVGGVLAVVTAIAGVVAARHWWLRGVPVYAIGMAGLVTCLVSPLSWTHHFVWVVPFAVGAVLGRELPRWQRILALVWAVWISAGIPLAVLPFKPGDAEKYTFGQDLIGNLCPLLGLIVVVGAAVQAWREHDRVLTS